MKKKIALLLACLMLGTAAFTSCGDEPEQEIEENEDENEDEASDETTAEAEDTTEAADDTTAESEDTTEAVADDTTEAVVDDTTEAPADTEDEPVVTEPDESVFGEIIGDTYVNEYLGLGFTLDDDMQFVNMSGMDMWVQKATTGATVLVAISSSEGMSEEEVLDSFVTGMASSNAEINVVEEYTVDAFGAMDYVATDYELDYGTHVAYVAAIVCVDGDNAIIIALVAAETAEIESLVGNFFPYDGEDVFNDDDFSLYDDYTPGVITDDTYYSEWLDVSFTLGEGLEFIEQDGMEMVAQNPETEEGIMIMVTDLDGAGMSEDEITELFFDSIKESFDASADSVEYSELSTFYLGSVYYTELDYEATLDGETVVGGVCVGMLGDYMVTITINALDLDTLVAIAGLLE